MLKALHLASLQEFEETPEQTEARNQVETAKFALEQSAELLRALDENIQSIVKDIRRNHVRATFNAELTRHNVKQDTKSDSRYSYFVGILEKVRELLSPFSDVAASSSFDPADLLVNKFDALKVYEPSKEFLSAPSIQKPKNKDRDPFTYEVAPSQSLAEALVAYSMMCADLKWLRSCLEFAANIIEDVLPMFEDHGGILAICGKYQARMLHREGRSIHNLSIWAEDEDKDMRYRLGDETYYSVVSVL
ncbi:hypothetical protein IL306_002799 [Fusarium sp. DS 682]|nr:hypothetical protein IL306_002799 [Fusarium sp. DS 682]